MKAAEIALRQEIRQMLSEAGINKTSMRIMAQEVLQQEIEKQVKNAISQNNINAMVYNTSRSYELKDMMREAIKAEITKSLNIDINIDAVVKKKEEQLWN